MLRAVYVLFVGTVFLAVAEPSSRAQEQHSAGPLQTGKETPLIEQKGTIVIPQIIPPPQVQPQSRSADPRCRQLTEEQRKDTPGCR